MTEINKRKIFTELVNDTENSTKQNNLKKKHNGELSTRKLRSKAVSPMQKLDGWLIQKGILGSNLSQQKSGNLKQKTEKNKEKPLKVSEKVTSPKEPSKISRSKRLNSNVSNKTVSKIQSVSSATSNCKKSSKSDSSPIIRKTRSNKKNNTQNISSKQQSTLTSFLTSPASKKTTFIRNDSFESVELPSFKNKANINRKQKRYEVTLPTAKDILLEQKELQAHKNRMNNISYMDDDSVELPSCEFFQPGNKNSEYLDCKHLSIKELSSLFRHNLKFLTDIVNGKVRNKLHDFYFKKNSNNSYLSENVVFNASRARFSFEQIEYLIHLLNKHFETENMKTHYFFQVLLPQLCLKIFTITHKMNDEEAFKHLTEQPFIHD